MRKFLLIFICFVMMFFVSEKLFAQKLISSLDSYNSIDPNDKDEAYFIGAKVVFVVNATDNNSKLTGSISINSIFTGYDSGVKPMENNGFGVYQYIWNTTNLTPSLDYIVSITLKDSSENQDVNHSLIINLDSIAPVISSVKSYDKSNITDSDNVYHAGQIIIIDMQESNGQKGLDATIRIKSDSVSYDSGVQNMTDQKDGSYRFIWTTIGLKEAKDYKSTVIIKNQFGKQSQDSSLLMAIDNKLPQNMQVLINGNDEYTLLKAVTLKISAENTTKIYIFGDVADNGNTFEWIPYSENQKVILTDKDGIKKVSVKFTNDAGNESSAVEDTIILDEVPPVITSVSSYNESDSQDNDGIYHSGQVITIIAKVDELGSTKLDGKIQITSTNAKYDSGLQVLKSIGGGAYTYRWDTVGLIESRDYLVIISFKDPSNREVVDRSLRITIDNLPPTDGRLNINKDQPETDSRSVILTLSAKNDPREMFIDGDIIKDTNTFNWISYATQIVVNLSDIDGKKQVNVRFRDAAKNESAITSTSIVLNRNTPNSTSIIIQDGANYTTTTNISLKLKAVNAEQMFIDGDVVDDTTTFEFIPYTEQISVKLTTGDGEKKIGVIFKNKLGIQSSRIQSAIILDTTSPVIFSVASRDSKESSDNDNVYRPGQSIIISAVAKSGETKLSGVIRIQSPTRGYNSGEQKMDISKQEFRYIWDTTLLESANDYNVWFQITDAVGLKSEDSSLKITLSNSPPVPGQVTINNDEKTTDSISVKLDISASDVTSMFISGDIVSDSNTFSWIPYQTKLVANLSGNDGQKNISVKFKNAAGNESVNVTASIVLNRNSPYGLGLIIANTIEDAKSGKSDEITTSQKVFLGLSAKNTTEVYISGDMPIAFNTFRWISYSPQIGISLKEGDGNKTVNVKFRNQRLIEGDPVQSEIILDTSAPEILSTQVQNIADPKDTDGWYHSGDSLKIIAEVTEVNNPKGVVQIKSEAVGYDSGVQNILTRTLISQNKWRFEYIWDTKEINKENSYSVKVTFTDQAGWSTTNNSLVINIDNTPPTDAKVIINKGNSRAASKSVTLEISAGDAVEVFVSGDVRSDVNTFSWIPLKASMDIGLTPNDGEKNVQVKFRDKARNETQLLTGTIILSELPPKIEKVDSWNTSDISNSDEKYHADELVQLALKAQPQENTTKTESALLATVSIVSADGTYKLADQKAQEENGGWYTYVWNTSGLKEEDYKISWVLSDGVGHSVNDNSLVISIDNTSPKNPSIIVNNKPERTKSKSVNLSLNADEVSWVFINGDVLNDKGLTFEWIPFSKAISVRLTDGDGIKLIQAKFKDDADNITEIIATQITLDTVGPNAVSIKINNNDGYTATPDVKLTVLAEDATMMYIDGDVSDNANVRKWIAYQKDSIDLKLKDDDGNKIVNVEFQDDVGNLSKKITDAIIFDSIPPKVKTVKSENSVNNADNDGKYLEGTNVRIIVDAVETGLSATIQISSETSGFDSAKQKMNNAGNGTYLYLWDTRFLRNAEDYIAKIELKDSAGNSITDNSLKMTIFDKPINPKISINNDDKVTTSQSVSVTFSADNASDINISGDVIDDSNTFDWIKFTESKELNLTSGDGVKNIKVVFRDSRSIEFGESNASIMLDQTSPTIFSIDTDQEIYRASDSAKIIIKSGNNEIGLKGTIQIKSFATGYDSGIQKTNEETNGEYIYLWDTTGLKEGNDYLIEATLSDESGLTAKDNSIVVSIDNTPPTGGSFTINDGNKYTNRRSVKLNIVPADTASEMLIQGDVIADSNTLQWIPITDEIVINLALVDSEKKILIKFRDKVKNEAKAIENSIILNELPPTINAIACWDESNVNDNDKIFHAGQVIKISIAYDNKEELTTKDKASQTQAWAKITSKTTGYDSGLLTATRDSSTIFSVLWKTDSVPESLDYIVEFTLQDNFNQKTTDKSLIITIDNASPKISKFLIDEGKNNTNLQVVNLGVTSDDAKEMFINGDIIEALNTFKWIPFTDTIQVRLSEDNGKKNITVKVKDSADNVSDLASASIDMDRTIPRSLSININNGDKYTDSYKITLALSAESAREMFISGDVVVDENTYKWILYIKELSVRLTNIEGGKKIFVKFRNGVNNESEEISVNILLKITPPGISKIEAFDVLDNTDNDLDFHSGQKILLIATASKNEPSLQAKISIKGIGDLSQKYDSGQQSMIDEGNGLYTFLWDTNGIDEGSYSSEITLEDSVKHSISDKIEITINNQKPYNPTIAINTVESFVYSRKIEVILNAEGSPSEVFISGDVISDDTTYKWIPFSPDENGKMKVSLNLRGNDGKKKITAVFRNKFRSESTISEINTNLELKKPELIDSCRIVQTSNEPIQAFLALQFDENIKSINLSNFFLTLKDKMNPQNFIQISGVGSELVLSNDIVMLEIPEEQLNEIKQWQPLTLFSSYIQAEMVEDSVFDMADKGNLGNKKKPADVYFSVSNATMDVSLNPSSFSPNDDGIKDKTTILYAITQTSDVSIKIRNSKLETIKEWNIENQLGGVVYPLEWSGKTPDGSPYPDGSYTVIVISKALEASGFAYGLKRNVTIDNTVPQITDIYPWEGAQVSALLSASVKIMDMPATGNIESVYITIDNDAENKMPLAKSKIEGEYVVPSTPALLIPIGKHSISFHAVDTAGNKSEKTVNYTFISETGKTLDLMNFPNPFPPGGSTTIKYALPEEVKSGEIVIYDAGNDILLLKELAGAELESGEHTFQWDGRDISSRIMARGIYFCKLSVNIDKGNKSKIFKIAIR